MSRMRIVEHLQFDERHRLVLPRKGNSKLTVKNYVNDIKSYNVWLNTEGHLPPQTGDAPLEIAAKASAIYSHQIKNSRDVAQSTTNRNL